MSNKQQQLPITPSEEEITDTKQEEISELLDDDSTEKIPKIRLASKTATPAQEETSVSNSDSKTATSEALDSQEQSGPSIDNAEAETEVSPIPAITDSEDVEMIVHDLAEEQLGLVDVGILLPLTEDEQEESPSALELEALSIEIEEASPILVMPDTILETPLPSFFDEETKPLMPVVEAPLPPTIVDTPRPAILDEDEGEGLGQVTAPTMPIIEAIGKPLRRRSRDYGSLLNAKSWRIPQLRRAVLVYTLLALLLISTLTLWRDATDTHLYVTTLDATNGEVLTQQDIGGGYQNQTTISAPVQAQSSLSVSINTVQMPSQVNQRLLTFVNGNVTWEDNNQFSTSSTSTYSTLTKTLDGLLLVEQANGLQIRSADGHLLWQLQGSQPTLGEHPFQPAFDSSTLYTVKSALTGQIGAYDLHSGTQRWIQTLEDTFQYAPPWLIEGDTLYVAGDHMLYALHRADGAVLWSMQRPSRTLLAGTDSNKNQLLLTAGEQGLTAVNPLTGTLVWSFTGQHTTSNFLSPTQFYQATSSANVVYVTGITWNEQQIQEQLWLYAVDTSTGTLRWSTQVGTGPVTADAGRIYLPLLDTVHGLVILEQHLASGGTSIVAFDATIGTRRWQTPIEAGGALTPALVQTANGHLILLTTIANSSTTLHSWSLVRTALIASIGLCLLLLLLLWILPWRAWVQQVQQARRNWPRYLLYPIKLVLRLWRFSHKLFALVLLLLLIGGGILEFIQLNQPQNRFYQVTASTGATQWQHITSTTVSKLQTDLNDAQGSIITTTVDGNLQQLQSLDRAGTLQWKTFSSEGAFTLPNVPSPAGTVLVALSGSAPIHYQFAPDDPAYPHAVEHLFTLSLLNRTNGQTIWQSTITSPDRQQNTVVLGEDAQFIYIASTPTTLAAKAVQLLAVDRATGNITWNLFGPAESNNSPLDNGTLLSQGRQLIWQVEGAIYAIDTTLGQIQWRQFLVAEDPRTLPQEEAQMAETSNALLVERNAIFYALDPASGNQLWELNSPGPDTLQAPAGFVLSASTLFVYGGGILQAIEVNKHEIIWSQKQVDAVQSLKMSDDGRLLDALIMTSIGNFPSALALTAFDTSTGAIRWTFQPSAQVKFLDTPSGSAGFQYQHGVVLAAVCLPTSSGSCPEERLYALNATTGATLWKFEGNSISDVHLSADGATVLFQANTSNWLDLTQRFRS